MTTRFTPVVRWAVPDPSVVSAALGGIGLAVGDGGSGPTLGLVPLADAWLSLEPAAGGRSPWGRLVAIERTRDRPGAVHGRRPGLLGIGWATIDAERAAADLGAHRIEALGRDDALGARAIRIGAFATDENPEEDRSWLDGGPALVLLEPDTEGRIAATLAQFGEGPAALYLVGPATPGRRAQGPFAGQRLIEGGPVEGPHLLLVDPDPVATIKR